MNKQYIIISGSRLSVFGGISAGRARRPPATAAFMRRHVSSIETPRYRAHGYAGIRFKRVQYVSAGRAEGEPFVCVMEDRISYLFVGSLAAPSRLFVKKTKPFTRRPPPPGAPAPRRQPQSLAEPPLK
ncbi:hypothetical protein EVAR_67579_1 [Eumeta japonica]|uniref:Uncharacterized protein n=1 Tax=Eumeta variegata TaxID=151549 RepID=A0A4C2A5V4_EUMVA|nr:hypothetical protein EVAR_67579_1 [Eumeta japonica]